MGVPTTGQACQGAEMRPRSAREVKGFRKISRTARTCWSEALSATLAPAPLRLRRVLAALRDQAWGGAGPVTRP